MRMCVCVRRGNCAAHLSHDFINTYSTQLLPLTFISLTYFIAIVIVIVMFFQRLYADNCRVINVATRHWWMKGEELWWKVVVAV